MIRNINPRLKSSRSKIRVTNSLSTKLFMLSLGLVLAFSSNTAFAQYKLTNLVSNQVGHATNDDPLIVNAWGMARSAGSPWWISDENSGWSTLYNGMESSKAW